MLGSPSGSDMLVITSADKEANREKNINAVEHQLFAR